MSEGPEVVCYNVECKLNLILEKGNLKDIYVGCYLIMINKTKGWGGWFFPRSNAYFRLGWVKICPVRLKPRG